VACALAVTCSFVSAADPLRPRAGRDRLALLVPERGRRDEREAFLTDMLVTLAALHPLVTFATRETEDFSISLLSRKYQIRLARDIRNISVNCDIHSIPSGDPQE